MEHSFNTFLLIGSSLLLLSILVSKTSSRISIPSVLLFIGIGMFGASDLIGIYFDDFGMAQHLGIVALALILFSGGLDTEWHTVKPVLRKGILLSTLGVIITTGSVGLFTHYITGLSILESLLLGAIVSSTDAAAVFSILRGKNLGLKGKLKPLLELESASNDPMAYFLTISLIYLIKHKESSPMELIPTFFLEFFLGGLFGVVMGEVLVWLTNRIKLDFEGLYPVLIFSVLFLTYSACSYVEGNGFLAVYIMGIIYGNNNFIHKKNIIRFYDGQAWLFQIIMFLLLGLLVFPKRIIPVIGEGLLISFFLIFIARPLGVFISLAFGGKSRWREKIFLSWVGLRGAVPIIFATYPLMENVDNAQTIFHIVFFIVLTSVLAQGTTIGFLARKLNLYYPENMKRKFPLDIEDDIRNELMEITVPVNSNSVGKSILSLHLPPTSLIILVERDSKFIQPKLTTTLEEGDKLFILTKNEHDFTLIHENIQGNKKGRKL